VRSARRRRPSCSSYWLQPLLAHHGVHDDLSAHNCRELLLAHCEEIVWTVATAYTAPKKIIVLSLIMKDARHRDRKLAHRL